jgi:hypothetical protein
MIKVPRCITALAGGALFAVAASAQPAVAPSVENFYARAGYPTVAVYVMGQVATPGKWRVEDGLPLMDLLAVTRPTNASPDRAGVEERVRVRLYREIAGGRQLTLDSELEPLLLGAQAETPLREGDLVHVALEITEPRERMSFGDILSILGTIASVGALVVSVAR